ncbi:MAG TPA: hypothetical protein VNS02_04990 [Rhizobiaceae bacterium]|nr:hypothetical protein [Rhizobiaceae bacterium]
MNAIWGDDSDTRTDQSDRIWKAEADARVLEIMNSKDARTMPCLAAWLTIYGRMDASVVAKILAAAKCDLERHVRTATFVGPHREVRTIDTVRPRGRATKGNQTSIERAFEAIPHSRRLHNLTAFLASKDEIPEQLACEILLAADTDVDGLESGGTESFRESWRRASGARP